MKPILLSILLACAIIVNAQTEKYTQVMGETLKALGTAKSAEEMGAVVAKLERIGDAEKTQWLPYYYAATTKARMSMNGMGDRDKLADEAATIVAKAEALSPNNSEIFCVKSMIATAKMIVDPMNRWQTYGGDASENLELAKKADPTNPRPYMLQAMSLKNTPEQFGGGCKQAKPLAEKAIALYATFKPASEIAPNWGKESVESVIADCK